MAKRSAANTKTKLEATLFLPGPEFWELWRQNGDSAFHRDQVTGSSTVTPERVPGGVEFAYPVRTAFAVPFWAATGDASLLEDVGGMQLERLGLKPANAAGRLADFHLVDQLANRSLAVATVLSPKSREVPFSKQPPRAFQVSPYLYDLPHDSVVIWMELGRLVLAVTRNESPVYFHALSADQLDEAAVQELKCILMQLETQEVIEGVDEVVVWLGARGDGAIADLMEKELGVKTRFVEPPRPRLSRVASRLLPEDVALMQHRQEQRRRWKNRLAVGAVVYVILLGIFAGRLWMTHQKGEKLRAGIAADRPAAESIRQTSARWEAFRPAIQPDSYPIEVLYKCAQLLPPRGLRLTEFEVRDGSIYLAGEAASASQAIRFKGDLMSKPLLADYEWNFPQPDILPSGGATFKTNGKLKYGGTEEK